MKKFYHHGQTIAIVVAIGVITSLLTGYFLTSLSAGNIELVRLEVNEKTSFLDFYTALLGGILGGVITLAGVALTIMNSDRKHSEQLAIEYRPYLDAVSVMTEGETICEVDELMGNVSRDRATVVDIDLMFTNKGRGFLSGWNMKTITPFNQSIDSSDLFMSPTYNFFMKMRFFIDPEKVINKPFEYTLSYNDEFDNSYTQKLHFLISTDVIREGENHDFSIVFKDIGRQKRVK